jgi:hypothetical protein
MLQIFRMDECNLTKVLMVEGTILALDTSNQKENGGKINIYLVNIRPNTHFSISRVNQFSIEHQLFHLNVRNKNKVF